MNANFAIHIMIPSVKYEKKLLSNWKKTKDQIHLMLKENCLNSKMTSYYFQNIKKNN